MRAVPASAASDAFVDRFLAELDGFTTDLSAYQQDASGSAWCAPTDHAVRHAQALDELVQRAEDLARVARSIATVSIADRAAVENVLAQVKLSALAARLAGREHDGNQQGGDFDLF